MEKETVQQDKTLKDVVEEQRGGAVIHAPWWDEAFTTRTVQYLVLVSVINFIVSVPLLFKDLTSSFSSSGALMIPANILNFIGIDRGFFFGFITFLALSIMPVSMYLFARKVFHKSETRALVATLFFIIPNPFFLSKLPFMSPFINGDGSHVIAFSLVPLFLLYFQVLVRQSIPLLSYICAMVGAYILIISPFTAFHLFFFCGLIAISEGFEGNIRLKLNRFFAISVGALVLSIFWYYPLIATNISFSNHLQYIIERVLPITPAALPLLLTMSATFYFVFNQQQERKSSFIIFSFFFVEIFFFTIASLLPLNGFFHPERFLLELSFVGSMFFVLAVISGGNFILESTYLFAERRRLLKRIKLISAIFLVIMVIRGVGIVQNYLERTINPLLFNIGVGGTEQAIDLSDIFAVIVGFLSLGVFVLLFYIIARYPKAKVD